MKDEVRVSAVQIASGQAVHDEDQKDLNKEGASYLSVFRERQTNAYGPLLEPLKGSWI